jgi:hypothetical protein
MEATMPIVVLWLGIPILLLGGGCAVVHFIHERKRKPLVGGLLLFSSEGFRETGNQ